MFGANYRGHWNKIGIYWLQRHCTKEDDYPEWPQHFLVLLWFFVNVNRVLNGL